MQTEPGFDIWTAFFSIASLIGFATASWLFIQKDNRRPFRWLGSIVLLFAIMLAEWVLWWTNYIQIFPFFRSISRSFPFFLGVLLLGYYRSAFHEKSPAPSFWHYLPVLLFLVKISPIYLGHLGIQPGDWSKMAFFTEQVNLFKYAMFLHFSAYPIWIYQSYRRRLEPDREMLRWHRWILGAYAGIVAAYWLHHVLSLAGMMNPRLDFIIAFFIAMFMALVGWLGIVQRRVLAGMPFAQAILPKKYNKSALSDETVQLLAERMLLIFERDKIHLDPDLTLDLLASLLGTSRHHASQAINSHFGMSFSDLVAKWRVEEAQNLLGEQHQGNLIIKEIAYQSGFNTKAAFNLTFKKWTGLPPTEFRRKSLLER